MNGVPSTETEPSVAMLACSACDNTVSIPVNPDYVCSWRVDGWVCVGPLGFICCPACLVSMGAGDPPEPAE